MNLYKTTIEKGIDVYVIAESLADVEPQVKAHLDKLDWFFQDERRVIHTELVATERPPYLFRPTAMLVPPKVEDNAGGFPEGSLTKHLQKSG